MILSLRFPFGKGGTHLKKIIDRHIKWVFSVPAIAFMVVMVASPVLGTFGMSLTDFNFLRGKANFVGFSNYSAMLQNADFWDSVRITFYYTFLVLIGQMLLGMMIALVLNEDFKGKNIIKTIILLPFMMAPLAVGLMWSLFYEPSSGIMNYFFRCAGLPVSNFVSAKSSVIPSIAAVEIWQNTPFVVIILLAALSSMPDEPLEAAKVDGANVFQTFFYVKLPFLMPTIFSCALLRFIDTFRQFDLIYALSLGGPDNASRTLSLFGYELAFSYSKFGEASTALTLLFLMVLVISIVVLRLRRLGDSD